MMYHIQNLLWVVCLLFFYMYKETEFIKTIMVYVYFRFLWLLCGCNTSDYLKSKEITIISLIKLTEFLGKTNPNFFNMFINNINKRNRDLLYQNELEHLLTKQMQNKTKRILISASRF